MWHVHVHNLSALPEEVTRHEFGRKKCKVYFSAGLTRHSSTTASQPAIQPYIRQLAAHVRLPPSPSPAQPSPDNTDGFGFVNAIDVGIEDGAMIRGYGQRSSHQCTVTFLSAMCCSSSSSSKPAKATKRKWYTKSKTVPLPITTFC